MALIVYDMQIGVIRQITDGARVVQSVAELLETARSRGFRIVFYAAHVNAERMDGRIPG